MLKGLQLKTKKVEVLTKSEIITFLRKQKPYLKKEFGVTKIALFGSYARDEQTLSSDIDLLIELKICDFRKRLRLRDYLESKLNKKVDLLYFDGVRKFVMRNILKDIVYA
jgi:uncharacterized protein